MKWKNCGDPDDCYTYGSVWVRRVWAEKDAYEVFLLQPLDETIGGRKYVAGKATVALNDQRIDRKAIREIYGEPQSNEEWAARAVDHHGILAFAGIGYKVDYPESELDLLVTREEASDWMRRLRIIK